MSAEPRRPRRRGTPISDSLGADLQALGGILASHTRPTQRIDQRHHNLLTSCRPSAASTACAAGRACATQTCSPS
jgi:hypothetical protein